MFELNLEFLKIFKNKIIINTWKDKPAKRTAARFKSELVDPGFIDVEQLSGELRDKLRDKVLLPERLMKELSNALLAKCLAATERPGESGCFALITGKVLARYPHLRDGSKSGTVVFKKIKIKFSIHNFEKN